MLRRWSSGGTSWYVIPDAIIAALYFAEASLSRIWCFGARPAARMRVMAFARAAIIEDSVLLESGSTQVVLLSILCKHIWYLLPRLEVSGNWPVWSVYSVCFTLYTLIMKSFFDGSAGVVWPSSASRGGGGLRRTDALPLASHVPTLRFFRLGEMFVYIFDGDERPGEKISFADGL